MNHRFTCHRTHLFSPDSLFSVNSLSLCEKQSKLAVLRRSLPREAVILSDEPPPVSNSYIEIWQFDMGLNLFLSQYIYEDEDEPCLLEALEWAGDGRLFACGLDSRLHQVDFAKGNLSKWVPLVSGPGWCMKFNQDKTLVAVGTEEGYVCIFKLTSTEIFYEKNLNRDAARVLSLAWHEPSNMEKMIISGSVGTIKIWDYEKGSCLKSIKLDDKSSVIAWCLEIVDPFIIVSGDSQGRTSFWDGNMGTWINSIDAHGGDVLCLASSKQDKTIFSSGVDPIIVKFDIDSSGRGVQSQKLYPHFHDVRSIVLYNNFLISTGYDCYISRISASPQMKVRQIPSFRDHVHMHKNRFLLQNHKSLELWQTGTVKHPDKGQIGDHLLMEQFPVKLADIKAKKMIHRSNFQGNWIIYSAYDDVKILLFNETSIIKVPLQNINFKEVISHIEFIDDSNVLIVSGTEISVLNLSETGVKEMHMKPCRSRVHKVCVSGKNLAISYDDLSFEVLNSENWNALGEFNLNKLPVFIKYNEYQPHNIYIGFPSKISIYNIRNKSFLSICPHEVNPYLPLEGITFHKTGLITHDQDTLYHYDGESWISSKKYSYIIKAEFIYGTNELVVVEFTEEMFKKKLPSALKKKRFGT